MYESGYVSQWYECQYVSERYEYANHVLLQYNFAPVSDIAIYSAM